MEKHVTFIRKNICIVVHLVKCREPNPHFHDCCYVMWQPTQRESVHVRIYKPKWHFRMWAHPLSSQNHARKLTQTPGLANPQ